MTWKIDGVFSYNKKKKGGRGLTARPVSLLELTLTRAHTRTHDRKSRKTTVENSGSGRRKWCVCSGIDMRFILGYVDDRLKQTAADWFRTEGNVPGVSLIRPDFPFLHFPSAFSPHHAAPQLSHAPHTLP